MFTVMMKRIILAATLMVVIAVDQMSILIIAVNVNAMSENIFRLQFYKTFSSQIAIAVATFP